MPLDQADEEDRPLTEAHKEALSNRLYQAGIVANLKVTSTVWDTLVHYVGWDNFSEYLLEDDGYALLDLSSDLNNVCQHLLESLFGHNGIDGIAPFDGPLDVELEDGETEWDWLIKYDVMPFVEKWRSLANQSFLERAIEIALNAHKDESDKAGAPYILHPLRVMLSLETYEERIVGVLHDVVEDTHWTFEKLMREGFSDRIIEAIRSVTKIGEKEEEYDDFILRASKSQLGRRVKIADLVDNMDMTRIKKPTEHDYKRLEKYKRNLKILKGD